MVIGNNAGLSRKRRMKIKVEITRFAYNMCHEDMLDIAQQYAAAIVRRGRPATDPEFLATVWRESGAYFVRRGRNFLILIKVGDVFCATHFAPETILGGYKLLRAIKEADLPICFAVPEDLAENLARMGWTRLPKWANKLAISRGLPPEKEVLIPKGLLKMAWQVFRRGDIFWLRDESPPEEISPVECEERLGYLDPVPPLPPLPPFVSLAVLWPKD